jgi:hypothetical protein
MATLKAAALVLDGLLVLFVSWGFIWYGIRETADLLIMAVLFACPALNAVTIVLQSRRAN